MKIIFRNTTDHTIFVPIPLAPLPEGAAEQDGVNQIVLSCPVGFDEKLWERRNTFLPNGVEVEIVEP